MRTTPTVDEIDRYRNDGFVTVPDMLEPREVDELAAGVERAVAAMGDFRLLGAEQAWKDSTDYYDQVFQQRLNLWRIDALVRRYMLGSPIAGMAAALAGVPLRVWHDQALHKMPWANPTSWHLDNPYWSFTSPDAISVWIALDDATLQNGCLWFLPGSHRRVRSDNVGIGPELGALFRVYPELASVEPVAALLPRGGGSFHNGLTAHGAGANMSPRWRHAMTCAYMPSGSTFNGQQNVLEPSRFARLQVGDSLDDDAQNPRVPEPLTPAPQTPSIVACVDG